MITIKSKNELELMRKAGEVVALAHKKAEESIKPGITTAEIDRIVEEVIRKNGAIPSFKGYKCPYPDGIDYPSSICASVNNEVVHGIPGLRELKDGDIISIDIGAYLNGFHGDAARTFAVGEISPEAEKLIEVTKQSFFEGIRNAVEGNRIVDISSAIENYIISFGFTAVREYVGHGIGREMHEEPQIPNYRTRERGPRIQRGMTIAVEPMINEGTYRVELLNNKWTVVTADGKLSAHYENTIAITENEPVILTMLD